MFNPKKEIPYWPLWKLSSRSRVNPVSIQDGVQHGITFTAISTIPVVSSLSPTESSQIPASLSPIPVALSRSLRHCRDRWPCGQRCWSVFNSLNIVKHHETLVKHIEPLVKHHEPLVKHHEILLKHCETSLNKRHSMQRYLHSMRSFRQLRCWYNSADVQQSYYSWRYGYIFQTCRVPESECCSRTLTTSHHCGQDRVMAQWLCKGTFKVVEQSANYFIFKDLFHFIGRMLVNLFAEQHLICCSYYKHCPW